jgi:hypothetical protein
VEAESGARCRSDERESGERDLEGGERNGKMRAGRGWETRREKWGRPVWVGGFGDETRSPPCTPRPSDGGGAGIVACSGATREPTASDGDRVGSVAACASIRFVPDGDRENVDSSTRVWRV